MLQTTTDAPLAPAAELRDRHPLTLPADMDAGA